MLSDNVIPGVKAIERIKACSFKRSDRKHDFFTQDSRCTKTRNRYTKYSYVENGKRLSAVLMEDVTVLSEFKRYF